MSGLRTILENAGVYVEPAKDEKGPARIAVLPSRGSSKPVKGKPMNRHTDITAAQTEARADDLPAASSIHIARAEDIMCEARELVHGLALIGEVIRGQDGSTIVTIANHAFEKIEKVSVLLHAYRAAQKGGEA